MSNRCKACNGLIRVYGAKSDGSEEDLCNDCLDEVQQSLNELEDNHEQ